jgi:hypothetical protein
MVGAIGLLPTLVEVHSYPAGQARPSPPQKYVHEPSIAVV